MENNNLDGTRNYDSIKDSYDDRIESGTINIDSDKISSRKTVSLDLD